MPKPDTHDKELDGRDHMFRQWRTWHREQLDVALAGAWGVTLRELLDFLGRMNLGDGDALINLVRWQGWSSAPVDLRYLVLREIDQAIARVREKNSLAPFDDALPWGSENPTVFSVIKEFLVGDDVSGAASASPNNTRGDMEQ